MILSCSFALKAEARTKIVVVLDSGLDLRDPRFTDILCKFGHKDFTGEGIRDLKGHGTHVLGSIVKYAPKSGWCAVIVKFLARASGYRANQTKAYQYVENIKPDYVNISAGNAYIFPEEVKMISSLKETKFIVAMGNDGNDLSKTQNNFYPAKYNFPNLIRVGALDFTEKRADFSNYGLNGIRWERGVDVLSAFPGGFWGMLSGTSMSTSIVTGKILTEDLNK